VQRRGCSRCRGAVAAWCQNAMPLALTNPLIQ
jgi:hypothetical protein